MKYKFKETGEITSAILYDRVDGKKLFERVYEVGDYYMRVEAGIPINECLIIKIDGVIEKHNGIYAHLIYSIVSKRDHFGDTCDIGSVFESQLVYMSEDQLEAEKKRRGDWKFEFEVGGRKFGVSTVPGASYIAIFRLEDVSQYVRLTKEIWEAIGRDFWKE